jgi:hypothetical protein
MSTVAALSPAEVLALPAMPTVKQAFAALNIGESAGYQLIRTEEFPVEVLRLGRNLRVRRADLLNVMGLSDRPADEAQPAA